MPLNLTDDKSTLVQVMAWCRQATSHYLSQCWTRSLSPYGVARPQWVNMLKWWISSLITSIPSFKKESSSALLKASRLCIEYFGRPAQNSWTSYSNHSPVTWASWHLKSPANGLFVQQSVLANLKGNTKPALLALYEGNPPVTSGFPSQRASNMESICISWCHHE